jgi:DNA polymerase III delta prime subunit
MIKLKIKSVKKLEDKKNVYDLTVSTNHNFFIGDKNEILTHNCTHVLQASQVILLNMMETFSLNTRFILTGNYPERLIEPLRSRCQEFNLEPPSKKEIALHIDNILNTEGIKHTENDVIYLVKKFYPDFRRMINACQKYTVDGKIKLDSSVETLSNYKEAILKILSKPDSKSLTNIRQILADADLNDYDEIYRFLFDNLKSFAQDKEGLIIIKLEEYLYHSQTRVDKEINFCAFIASILNILK